MRVGSKAVWNFSKKSSVLVPPPVPVKGQIYHVPTPCKLLIADVKGMGQKRSHSMTTKISEFIGLCFAITTFILNPTLTIHFWLTTGCQIQENKSTKGKDIWKGGTKEIFFWKHIEKDYHNFFFKPNNQNLKAVKRWKRDGKDRCDINSDSAWPCVVFEGPLMYLKAIFSSELQWGIGHYQHQPGLADVIEQRTAVDKKTDWYALDEDLGVGPRSWAPLGKYLRENDATSI